jgi:hypothetical protein
VSSLTCEYCQRAPATCCLVADLHVGRVTSLVCVMCGTSNIADARKIAKTPSSAWLFVLAPAGALTEATAGG